MEASILGGQRGRHSLAWATIVALVLTAVLPVALVGTLAVVGLQRALTDRATTDLRLLAEAQAGRLELIAASTRTHTRLIASRTQLRRDMAAVIDGDTADLGRIGDILTDIVAATSEVVAVALVDTEGAVLAGPEELAAGPQILGLTAIDLDQPTAVWSAIATLDDRDRWLAVTPLHLEGRVLGAAVVEFDTRPVEQVLFGPIDTAGARTCGFRPDDRDGLLPLLAGAQAVGSECGADGAAAVAATGGLTALATALRSDPDTPLRGSDSEGVALLAAGREVRSTGWLVLVTVPRDDLLAPVRPSVLALAVAAIGVAVLAAVAAVFLGRRLTGPIIRLSQTVRAIGAGDLDARADPSGPGELGDLAAGVNRMADTLAQGAREREQRYQDLEVLTHAMAHDLKNPLTTIRGMLDLVTGDRVTDEAQRADLLERARGAALRMQGNITDLLTLLRAHGAELHRRPVNLEEVVDQAAQDLGITEVVERAALPTVPGDPILLGHVLQNLLSNAVTYHAPGTPPRVVVTSAPTSDGIELWIEDAGIGIPAQEREHVLELFFRGEGASRTLGTGLGLPIAARAIERHGGQIRIEDSSLGGTRVVIWLPVGASAPTGA